MSNPWRAQVNQKLYFTQLMLADARARDGQLQQAAMQAAVFHLATAYRLYLKEIALYQRHTTYAVNARAARRQLIAQGWQCQELEVLAQLEEEGQWPADLLQALRAVEGEMVAAKPKQAAVSGAIAMTDVTDSIDVTNCQQWLESLQVLIDQQREAAQEW